MIKGRANRPSSLREVAEAAQAGGIDALLREFMDEFNKAKDQKSRFDMVRQEPMKAAEGVPAAYLAAVAEYLCRTNGMLPPAWVEKPQYFLRKPHFGSPLQNHKAILLASSPAAFRRRLIFVGSNPLSRPHSP